MTEPNITPLARRLAEENGIDWRSLEGSGPDGTIVERDILAFLAKVMAGEVELPPQPEDIQPPEELPDISQVQEALAKEGVDLEEIMPGITAESSAEEPKAAAEEVIFEMDFEEDEEEEIYIVREDIVDDVAVSPETEAVEGYFAAEAPSAEEDSSLTSIDSSATEAEKHTEQFDEVEVSDLETSLEPTENPSLALEELEEEFSWESATEEHEEVANAGEAYTEGADWDYSEELELETAAIEATQSSSNSSEGEQENIAEFPGVDIDETTGIAKAGDQTSAGAAMAVFPPAFRRVVAREELEKARADLSESWKRDVPTSLLLFRAVERALAELEVPMRAVRGKFENESVTGLKVDPADNLRNLYDNYINASEPAEGLIVLDLGETPYAEILIPSFSLVTLGYKGMPHNLGLLSVSGELPTDKARFIERVAFYLERPILLA